jgi:hypothetical protein
MTHPLPHDTRRGFAPLAAVAAVASASLIAAATICVAAPADGATAFVNAWRQATASPGGDAIAELTAFPFLFEGRPLRRADFVATAVPALFTPAVRRCLQRATPLAEPDGRRTLSCAPYGFVFASTAAGWRLVDFFVDTP